MVGVDGQTSPAVTSDTTADNAARLPSNMETVIEEPAVQSEPNEGMIQATDDKVNQTATLKPPPPLITTTFDHNSSVRASDATSERSSPYVSVTEPQSPLVSARGERPTPSSSTAMLPPPSPARSTATSTREPSNTRAKDRPQRRSTLDARAANRLSGFFGGLVNRRASGAVSQSSNAAATRRSMDDRPTPASAQKPSSAAAEPAEQPAQRESEPPPRPTTPPPLLPAPTLSELGLTLSTVTASLSPAHFSSPPTSGAFLAPHYLLLCHAQGLDVLPLVYPPMPQPYALVRRVMFKSVVVMEHRGVLVAIAGRRDGVRVYALEEVKKAIEWRIELEVRRERDRTRREEAKRGSSSRLERADSTKNQSSASRSRTSMRTASMSTLRTSGANSTFSKESISAVPPIPTRPSAAPQNKPPEAAQAGPPLPETVPSDPPPAYSPQMSSREVARPTFESHTSAISVQPRAQRTRSVSDALSAPVRESSSTRSELPRTDTDIKGDWVERSVGDDEEAIDVVAAGASGSQALDERTSAMASGHPTPALASPGRTNISPVIPLARTSTSQTVRRNNRPADLDLTEAMPDPSTPTPQPQPSPVATLTTLRQSLLGAPLQRRSMSGFAAQEFQPPATGEDEEASGVSEGETPAREQISFAQALMESRLPELPPPGSRRTQQPILLTNTHPVASPEDEPASPRSSDAHTHAFSTRRSVGGQSQAASARSRRRWSVFDGIFNPDDPAAHQVSSAREGRPPMPHTAAAIPSEPVPPLPAVARARNMDTRASTGRIATGTESNVDVRSQASASAEVLSTNSPQASRPPTPSHSGGSGLISRILSSAFHHRRSEDRGSMVSQRHSDTVQGVPGHPAPAPKLEYVKLPGTKGALMIKSVETAKKSFLAILCGDNGEKVELFAGTYRTALGLSRTFILPDSPRSLELQLQGDDLVEVFLVFSQNVFGLEPATVRVREVRIGRAERRAARRRARDGRQEEGARDNNTTAEDETNVSVTAVVASDDAPAQNEDGDGAPLEPGTGASAHTLNTAATADGATTPVATDSPAPGPSTSASTDDTIAHATAQMGPFTTFQQLSFAPQFPLASIADEYIIPPTYASFLQYRMEHEPEVEGANGDLASVQFTPPGLPIPQPAPPSKWCYRDPKGVVHGPWKASLMQNWYKDGLLPPDLPVRREEDTEYILLKDLRAQSVDPTHPFRPAAPPLQETPLPLPDAVKPLLSPISLLSQPRHFGPPALFFSSRGGHSTTIVDTRGRSVIRGRFIWTPDDGSSDVRMGDVRRLEAFDVKDRSVLVAMRQGGLEAVDLSDALLRPGDASRPVLPHFVPQDAMVNRRSSFLWRIGNPTGYHPSSAPAIASLHSAGSRTSGKKQSISMKSPSRSDPSSGGEGIDGTHVVQDEVFFVGRKDDDVYLCERNAGTFRILRLCPDDL